MLGTLAFVQTRRRLPMLEDWATRVDEPHTEAEFVAIRRSVCRGTPYGSQPWAAQTAARLGLESTIRPPDQQEELASILPELPQESCVPFLPFTEEDLACCRGVHNRSVQHSSRHPIPWVAQRLRRR